MRIQHNILSMNAYRNYSNNTSALGRNLEKLSSGYKINRAGDDAAGLAISEKMRAQIKGLDAAQKNVKDGISFVKTAEGAMQEIQDMLSRMKYLATQSANGTYENSVDRKALQDEVDSLLEEIDRIADSANFNDIYMLSGGGAANQNNPQSGPQTSAANDGIMLTANPGISMAALKPSTGSGTKVEVSATGTVAALLKTNGSKTGASFANKSIDVTFTTGTGSKAVTKTIKIGFGSTATKASGVDIHVQIAGSASNAAVFAALKSAVETYGSGLATNNAAQSAAGTYLDGITVAQASGGLKFTGTFRAYEVDSTQSTGSGSSTKVAAGAKVEIDLTTAATKGNFQAGDTIKIGETTYTFTAASASASASSGTAGAAAMPAAANVNVTLGSTFAASMNNLVTAVNAQKDTTGVQAAFADGKLTLTTTKDFASADEFESAVTPVINSQNTALKDAVQGAWDDAVEEAVKNLGGGDEYSITLQIGDTAQPYNQMVMKIKSMKTDSIGVSGLKINTITDAAKSIDIVKKAINTVSSVRGQLGAYQNRLEHTANNLSVMSENITDAESTIRDTDVADEMMAYTKNNILIQSAQAMLAQANAVPQGVLQLLQ